MDVTGYMSIMIWFSADVQKLDVWWNKTQRCFGKKKHVFFGSRSWIRKDVFAWYQWYSTRWESLYHRWVNLQVHTFFAFQACKAGWFCNGLKSIKKRAAFAQWLVLFAFAAFKEMMFNFYKKLQVRSAWGNLRVFCSMKQASNRNLNPQLTYLFQVSYDVKNPTASSCNRGIL